MPTIRKRLDPLKARKPGRPNRLQIFTTSDGYATRIECPLEHDGGHRYRRTDAWSKWACEGCGDVQDAMELADRQVVARTRSRREALSGEKKVAQKLYLATTQIGDQVFSVTFFAEDNKGAHAIMVQHSDQWIELGKNELDLKTLDRAWPKKAVDAGFRKEPDSYFMIGSFHWALRSEAVAADDVRGIWRSLGDVTGVMDRVILDLNNMRQLVLALEDQSDCLTKKLKSLRSELKAHHENARLVAQDRADHGRQIQG